MVRALTVWRFSRSLETSRIESIAAVGTPTHGLRGRAGLSVVWLTSLIAEMQLRTPSLSRMRPTCLSTVRGLISSNGNAFGLEAFADQPQDL
jgi:hypothetical protein